MAANIYRKTALDKLSSPDQLDKSITIISPSFWIAMAGMGAILLIALAWAIFGRIPVTVSTDGIYMNPGGIRSVATAVNGFVDEVYVVNGDAVKSGQKLAHIDTSNIEEELAVLQKRRDSVEKVTFTSEGDVGSSDNKALLDIKAQKVVSNATLTTDETALKSREQELVKQKAKTEAARQEYEAARVDYLNSMDASSTSAEQLAYQDAQSELSTSRQYYENARNSISQTQAQGASLYNQKEEVDNTIQEVTESLEKAQADLETANTEAAQAQSDLETAQANAQASTAATDSTTDSAVVQTTDSSEDSAIVPVTDQEDTDAQTAVQQAQAALEAAQAKVTELTNTVTALQNQLSQLKSQQTNLETQIKTNEAQTDSASSSVDEWYDAVTRARADYNAAEDAYIAAMQASQAQQGNTSREGATYNVALQNYTSELQARRNLEDATLQLLAQVASDRANLENQNSALRLQFDSARAGVLDQLNQEIDNREKQIKDATIVANRDGYVAGMNIAVGNAVQQGTTVCRISSDQKSTGQDIICYALVTQGRKMKAGMEAMVYPSTVNRQEYGHIKGKIVEVSDYVISAEEMANQIGDNSLVQMFQQKGPVVRVVCELETDDSTASGYKWSSNKGAQVELSEGTIVTVDVVTEDKAPISMVIPYLKEQFMAKNGQSAE